MTELVLRKAKIMFSPLSQLIIEFKPELRVSKQQLVVILGPNGSGKTILLEMLSGIFPARPSGNETTSEIELEKKKSFENMRIGLLPANPSLFFMQATVFEEFISASEERGKQDDLQLWHNWEAVWKQYAGYHPLTLSVGMQRMLIVDLLITRGTDVFFLDEPLSSIDGREQILLIHKVRNIIRDSKIVVITTANEMTPLLFGSQAKVFIANVVEDGMQKKSVFVESSIKQNSFTKFVNEVIKNASFEEIVKSVSETENA